MATAPLERPVRTIPPLTNGDNLTREEFERLWDLHPESKHAERIDGIVYLETSVSPDHGVSHTLAMTWLGVFWAGRPGIEVGDNGTVRLDDDDLQPDAYLRRTEAAGGRSRPTESAIQGTPEFVFEVAASSAAYDLHQKFDVYERNQVPEYVVWQVFENKLDWFVLRDGRYVSVEPGTDGIIESEQFPGLRLHVPSLLGGDLAGVLAALRR